MSDNVIIYKRELDALKALAVRLETNLAEMEKATAEQNYPMSSGIGKGTIGHVIWVLQGVLANIGRESEPDGPVAETGDGYANRDFASLCRKCGRDIVAGECACDNEEVY